MHPNLEKSPYDFGELARADYRDLPPRDAVEARDGTPLAFRRYLADAPVSVVALHGSAADGSCLHPLASHLARAGRASVYVPDLRGHGASGGRRGDVDHVGQLEEDLADFLAAVREARPGDRVVLLGHGSGGGLAVRWAGARRPPLVDGHVLLAPFLGASAPTTRPAWGGWVETDVPSLLDVARRATHGEGDGQDRVVLRFHKAPADRTGREVLAYTFRMAVSCQPRPDLASDLSAIGAPLLLLCGSRDESFVADRYEPTIAPHAPGTFLVMPGLTHLGLLVSEQTAEVVGGWLAALAEEVRSPAERPGGRAPGQGEEPDRHPDEVEDRRGPGGVVAGVGRQARGPEQVHGLEGRPAGAEPAAGDQRVGEEQGGGAGPARTGHAELGGAHPPTTA